jgi:hypothetical protein
MKPNRNMNGDWGQYPELEEVAERGCVSAFASGQFLAGLILTLATSNLLVCVLDQPSSRELLVNFDQVSALVGPRSSRSTDQAPGRNG